MSPEIQTVVALAIVAAAACWLLWRAWAGRGRSGCGDGACGAVSPEARAWRKKMRKRPD
jgi:hypothetical protein